jgi:hypothetical protein
VAHKDDIHMETDVRDMIKFFGGGWSAIRPHEALPRKIRLPPESNFNFQLHFHALNSDAARSGVQAHSIPCAPILINYISS